MSTPGVAVPGTNVPSGVLVTPGGSQGIQGLQGPTGPILFGHIAGLTLANGSPATTMLSVASGAATDSTAAVYLINSGTFNKSISGTWAVGSGNNGMGKTLTAAASTWYHVFAIINSGLFDIYFDTSVNGTNAPTGTTAFRRIGSIKLNASAQIIAFTQFGDEFLWLAPPNDIQGQSISTANVLLTLSVPLGVKVYALLQGYVGTSGQNVYCNLTAPDIGSQPVDSVVINRTLEIAVTGITNLSLAVPITVRTNTASQIQAVSNSAGASVYLTTNGWIDLRGKNN